MYFAKPAHLYAIDDKFVILQLRDKNPKKTKLFFNNQSDVNQKDKSVIEIL